MEAVSIGSGSSPFRDFVRARVERVLASWEAAGAQAGGPPGKAALRRFLKALDELAEATDALLPEQRSVEQPSAEPAARPYVLLVIEEPGLAQDLQAGLEPEHEVERISTPERAAQSVAARTPDVVVASGSGAPETARRIRELLHGLPAVVAAPDPELAPLAVEFAGEPVVLLRGAADAKELGLAIRTMLALSRQTGASGTANVPVPSELIGEPRSYAHLAGLLPRSLEHTIEFDVGAAVVARPGSEPLVDVHATSDFGEETLRVVRARALALFRIVAGEPWTEDDIATATARSPLRSSLHVPLAIEGRIVGLTYLAALRPGAFTADDRRLLATLATNASVAYRRLEGASNRLRQSQVLALIASGLSDKQIAARLGLAHRTVRTHLDRFLREHGLHSRTEAIAAWLRSQER